MMTLLLGLGTTRHSETAPGISTSHQASAGSPVVHHSLPAKKGENGQLPLGQAGNRALLFLGTASQEPCKGEEDFKRFRHLTQL